MRTLTKFLSQRGMTLMEIMVGAALMGGIALVGAKLMDDQASNQAYIKTKASIASKISRLEFFMSNPETCKMMLAGKLVPSTLGTPSFKDPSILSYNNPVNGSLVNLLGETTYGDYSIPDGGVTLQNSAFGDKVVEVAIKFDVENKSTFRKGSTSYTRKIQIVAQRNGGAIEACGPVLKDSETAGKERMCDTLGAAAAWNGTDCVLVGFECPQGQVVTKVNNLADLGCEEIKDKINLPDIFDTASTACGPNPQIQIVESGGKFKLSCGAAACTSCTAIKATYCPSEPAQFNSCGVSCGPGTKNPTQTCASIAADFCPDTDAGSDSCGTPCGMGTKNAGCSTPDNFTCVDSGTTQPDADNCGVGNVYNIQNNGTNTGTTCVHELNTTVASNGSCVADPSPSPYTDCPAYPGCPVVSGSVQTPTKCVKQSPVFKVGPDGCQRLEMYNILDQNSAIINDCYRDWDSYNIVNGKCSKMQGPNKHTTCPALPGCPAI